MGTRIHITEVSPRDGLQNQKVAISTEGKRQLISLLAAAGLESVEVTSFVSPKAVPQMADAQAVLSQVQTDLPELRVSVLVPNMKGLERSADAGAREIAVVLSATETMNQKNINMSLEAAAEVSEQTLQAARERGLRTRGYVAVAVECPFEGLVMTDRVAGLAARLWAAGAQEIVLADTIGAAAPSQIRDLIRQVSTDIPIDSLALHLHDTRGMALANAWAALEEGVCRFDASVGGVGGCPFAPGAAGNLATEDLVLMAEQCGYDTGVSLPKLQMALRHAESLVGHALGGRSWAWLSRRLA